jgi:hypothetical protein
MVVCIGIVEAIRTRVSRREKYVQTACPLGDTLIAIVMIGSPWKLASAFTRASR